MAAVLYLSFAFVVIAAILNDVTCADATFICKKDNQTHEYFKQCFKDATGKDFDLSTIQTEKPNELQGVAIRLCVAKAVEVVQTADNVDVYHQEKALAQIASQDDSGLVTKLTDAIKACDSKFTKIDDILKCHQDEIIKICFKKQ